MSWHEERGSDYYQHHLRYQPKDMAVLAMRGPSAAENPAGGSDNRRDIASTDSCPSEQHRIHGR